MVERRRRSLAGKVTAGLAESNVNVNVKVFAVARLLMLSSEMLVSAVWK